MKAMIQANNILMSSAHILNISDSWKLCQSFPENNDNEVGELQRSLANT
jgi:hypothetical protein